MSEHVHDCTGPDARCPCGYTFVVAPIWFSIEIGEGQAEIVNDAFNCSDIAVVIGTLKRIITKLEGRSGPQADGEDGPA